MNRRETPPREFLEELDDYAMLLEGMRAAARAHETSGFAEFTGEYTPFRVLALREDGTKEYTVTVEHPETNEELGKYSFPEEAVTDAVREHGEVLNAHRVAERKLAASLEAAAVELREGGNTDGALSRIIDNLGVLHDIRTVDCTSSQGYVVFADDTAAMDGIAVHLPEERWTGHRME